ncbi:hypothetical protein [Streptomyces thermolilacinus]|uniref:hypothetical protein n=1 Tax=Streptomyces thermolilacinus TaxID=285540 RepID=UPI0033E31554
MNVHVPLRSELHTSQVYVAWVRAHDPGAEPAAVALLDEVASGVHRAREKPGRFVEGLERRARELPPAHRPWFWDTVAHRLCGWSDWYAGRAFALARKAEREHTLPVDRKWRAGTCGCSPGPGRCPRRS